MVITLQLLAATVGSFARNHIICHIKYASTLCACCLQKTVLHRTIFTFSVLDVSCRAMVRPLSFDRSKASPVLCIAILIALNLAFYSKAAPTLRLVELAVCREHYLAIDAAVVGIDGHVPENLCKLEPIQRKVAWLFTLDELLHFCCDFVATIPAGLLTDRHGPRPALLLNVGGFIASWAWVVVVCKTPHR